MANTAQTVEREAPQAAEVKWQKPSNFKRFLKRAWDCKILLAHVAACIDLRYHLLLHTHDWYRTCV